MAYGMIILVMELDIPSFVRQVHGVQKSVDHFKLNNFKQSKDLIAKSNTYLKIRNLIIFFNTKDSPIGYSKNIFKWTW